MPVQERDGISPDAFAMSGQPVLMLVPGEGFEVREGVAEIGDRPRRQLPAFLGGQMAHVGPRIERLYET